MPSGPAGRASAVPSDMVALQEARDSGVRRNRYNWARRSYPDRPERAARADRYLREDVKYGLGERELAGLERFYELAAEEFGVR